MCQATLINAFWSDIENVPLIFRSYLRKPAGTKRYLGIETASVMYFKGFILSWFSGLNQFELRLNKKKTNKDTYCYRN
jgi:hypothetical protein